MDTDDPQSGTAATKSRMGTLARLQAGTGRSARPTMRAHSALVSQSKNLPRQCLRPRADDGRQEHYFALSDSNDSRDDCRARIRGGGEINRTSFSREAAAARRNGVSAAAAYSFSGSTALCNSESCGRLRLPAAALDWSHKAAFFKIVSGSAIGASRTTAAAAQIPLRKDFRTPRFIRSRRITQMLLEGSL